MPKKCLLHLWHIKLDPNLEKNTKMEILIVTPTKPERHFKSEYISILAYQLKAMWLGVQSCCTCNIFAGPLYPTYTVFKVEIIKYLVFGLFCLT